jgi:hypothetical protein
MAAFGLVSQQAPILAVVYESWLVSRLFQAGTGLGNPVRAASWEAAARAVRNEHADRFERRPPGVRVPGR